MGTYGITEEDIEEEFKDFLHSQEGDVSAEVIANVWNKLSKKEEWGDYLKSYNTWDKEEDLQ